MKKLLNIVLVTLVGLLFLAGLTLFVWGILTNSFLLMLICSIIQIVLVIASVVYIRYIESQLDDCEEECKSLSSDLQNLRQQNRAQSARNKIVSHEKQVNTDPENLSKEDDSSVATIQTVKTEIDSQPVQEFFYEYYSSPNANGAFDRGYAKSSLADDSFYKVSGKMSETHAKVELLKKKDYKRLFDFKSDCLYPVCEIANNRQDGTSIMMVEAGCVNLQENKWVIDNKKKIIINIV